MIFPQFCPNIVFSAENMFDQNGYKPKVFSTNFSIYTPLRGGKIAEASRDDERAHSIQIATIGSSVRIRNGQRVGLRT